MKKTIIAALALLFGGSSAALAQYSGDRTNHDSQRSQNQTDTRSRADYQNQQNDQNRTSRTEYQNSQNTQGRMGDQGRSHMGNRHQRHQVCTWRHGHRRCSWSS
jgi:hypothetical protein